MTRGELIDLGFAEAEADAYVVPRRQRTEAETRLCRGLTERITNALRKKNAASDRRVGVQIIKDYEPFDSPVDGSVIGSRREHREHMKRHNLRQVEPSEFRRSIH